MWRTWAQFSASLSGGSQPQVTPVPWQSNRSGLFRHHPATKQWWLANWWVKFQNYLGCFSARYPEGSVWQMVSGHLILGSVREGLSIFITFGHPKFEPLCCRSIGPQTWHLPLTSLRLPFSLWTWASNDTYIPSTPNSTALTCRCPSWRYTAAIAVVEEHLESFRNVSCPKQNLWHQSSCITPSIFPGAGEMREPVVSYSFPIREELCLWRVEGLWEHKAPGSRPPSHTQILTGNTRAERKT